jgi:phosphoketolase
MKTHSDTLLYDNPLLSKPLELAHVKRRLFSHWARPGLNLVYGFVRIAGSASGPTASGPNRAL